MDDRDDQRLRTIWQQRQRAETTRPLAKGVEKFVQEVVEPRRRKLTKLAEAWHELLPMELLEHSCLESLRRGSLTVLVDSAAHLYELQLLVQEGLLGQLQECCPAVSVARIKLKRGRWYRTDEGGEMIPYFRENDPDLR